MPNIDKTISDYITYVRSLPTLTREEEVHLYKAWRDRGDYRAREKILNASLRYVTSVALKFRRYPIPLEDLISEGNLGLIRAVDNHYDPDSGNRFVTFAVYWIRAYILNYVVKFQNTSASGVKFRSKEYFKFHRERIRAQNSYSTRSEVEQSLSKSLGIPVELVQKYMQATDKKDLSLSMDAFKDTGGHNLEIGDTLISNSQRQDDYVVDSEVQRLYKEAVKKALVGLTPRELKIVRERLMRDPEEAKTLKEIGEEFGVCRERVRQLEVKAMNKLKAKLEPMRGLV